MNFKKLFLAAASCGFGLLFAPGEAKAAVSYVCETFFAHDSSKGNNGYVYASFYSQPNCAGTFTVGAIFCSTGATDTAHCSTSNLYASAELQGLIQNLQRAAAARQPTIPVYTGAKGEYVVFRSL